MTSTFNVQRFHADLNFSNLYHKLRTMDIGTVIKHAEIFTKDEELQLWKTGTLGTHLPQALLCTVFYLNGMNFCLRGGEEHRSLKISQLKRSDGPPTYTYVENGSKNRNGTFSQRYIPNKTVPIHANPLDKERCHVRILDVYISKLSEDAIAKDVFYVRPVTKIPANKDLPWFTSVPIGTSNSSSKTRGADAPALELLGVFLRFRITFAEVITFSGASAHEF